MLAATIDFEGRTRHVELLAPLDRWFAYPTPFEHEATLTCPGAPGDGHVLWTVLVDSITAQAYGPEAPVEVGLDDVGSYGGEYYRRFRPVACVGEPVASIMGQVTQQLELEGGGAIPSGQLQYEPTDTCGPPPYESEGELRIGPDEDGVRVIELDQIHGPGFRQTSTGRVGADGRFVTVNEDTEEVYVGQLAGSGATDGLLLVRGVTVYGHDEELRVVRDELDVLRTIESAAVRRALADAVGIDADDGRGLVDHLRLGIGDPLAGLERTDAAEQPVQAVGGATVALAGQHRGAHRLHVGLAEAIAAQDVLRQFAGLFQGQSNHGAAPLLTNG